VQFELGAVDADAVALAFRDNGDVTVSETAFVGCCVGGGVGATVDGACVGVAVRWADVAGGDVCAVVADGVDVIKTSWGVVPGPPGMLVTCAPDVAVTPRGVGLGDDDPESAGEHAPVRAIAHEKTSLEVAFMAARGIRK
jgi:hypothetical protein